jgi:3-phenylpropionate/trans-cinnamate dioxygenase ferredoxin component
MLRGLELPSNGEKAKMDQWIRAAAMDEIPPGGLRALVGDEEILLIRMGDGVRAISYLCSHQEMALEGGALLDGAWVCPHHGARFSLETGEALSMPAVSGVKIFHARVEDGIAYVML